MNKQNPLDGGQLERCKCNSWKHSSQSMCNNCMAREKRLSNFYKKQARQRSKP